MSLFKLPPSARADYTGVGGFAPVKNVAVAGTTDLTFSWTRRSGVSMFYYRLEDANSMVNPIKEGITDQASYVYSAADQEIYGQPKVGTTKFCVAEYDPVRKLYGPISALDGAAAFNSLAPYGLTARQGQLGAAVLEWKSGSVVPFKDTFFKVSIYKNDMTTVLSTATVTDGPYYVYPLAQNKTDNAGTPNEIIRFSVVQVDAEGNALTPPSPIYVGPFLIPVPPEQGPVWPTNDSAGGNSDT